VDTRIKRLKQLVTGSRLRSRTAASGEALLWAQLVAWALHEPVAQELRAPLTARPAPEPAPEPAPDAIPFDLSGWQLSVLVLDTLRQVVRGTWDAARVHACLPRLRRFLGHRRRRDRVYQETAAVAWLSGLAPPPGHARAGAADGQSGFS
jgi:hypothetical protein